MDDERTYEYTIALGAVTISDSMIAESADFLWEVLGTVTRRIVNEVKGVKRAMYDCTGKQLKGIIDLRGHLGVLFLCEKKDVNEYFEYKMKKLLLKGGINMTRKQLIAEIIYTTIIRGVLTFMFAFMCIGMDCLHTWFRPFGLIIAVCFIGLYIYSVIDEVRLFFEAYREAKH